MYYQGLHQFSRPSCSERTALLLVSSGCRCLPRGQTCTKQTKLQQYVSACIMYRHVTATDPLRDVMVTLFQTVGWVRDMVAGYRFSLSSCTSHCLLSLSSGNSAASSNEPWQDMKMLRKLAVVWAVKMYRFVRILYSQFIKKKKKNTRREFWGGRAWPTL